MSIQPIRVLLADDHKLVRSGLCALLDTAPDIVVVGEANGGREAIVLARRLEPDVVVMDLSMPDLDGLSATREILAQTPTRVLILTMHEEVHYLSDGMRAGASGFLLKSVAHRELIDAIRRVSEGRTYVRPASQMRVGLLSSTRHAAAR